MGPQGIRQAILCALPVAAMAGALVLFDPFAQPLYYHDFADRRAFLGIANFADVASNLAFLVVGTLGLFHCLRFRPPGARLAWTVFFLGLVLVSFGSGAYHRSPDNGTLVWDRLAMMIGFMGLYVALVAEYVGAGLEKHLLPPALFAGLGAVLYWHGVDDLRFYFALQATVFVSAAVILAAFESTFRQKAFILAMFACHLGAMALEQLDHQVFSWTGGVVGGHALKHLMAGFGGYWIYRMLVARRKEAGAR
ncbi:MAG: ceramidase domain-containing protein [Alphaproteobacteria bacterium]|nr:ceramidase domain-containing protein [Alphaproteobacteria bacterium]